jgi:uncharacterized membrane protein YfcA
VERSEEGEGVSTLAIAGGLGLGLVIGVISGMIGIGGGAFLIPALIFFYGMSQKTAQGTSVATLLLPIGAFAFWTYYKAGHVNVMLALLIAIGFAFGGWVGGLWAQHLSDVVLRRGFAVLLVLLAVKLGMER